MKTSVKSFWLFLPILFAGFVWTVGCAGLARQHPDPLAGWKPDFDSRPSDQAIEKDYQNYIQKLPTKERISAGPVESFQDGTGQHAVRIIIGINGTVWENVLIYDKDNKRIKVIKYSNGGYAS
jgi:hypothetical protein